ncbi:MAG: tRNA uridine-5-carboxymethylaminomethyl(34) synthesis enzyme MnmG [Bdellovibrio sp.]|nr:tRNA uridine-5-carboxymethylaminomethyl(34) synthesis enzyme MnmG [Bdellovibrio sp.]
MSFFDVIIIGGGHAGCEAAHAAAKMGTQVAMITLSPQRIGWMSCNPAKGGLAKGQLVKEIDALGGVMGINTDKTAIQYRRLNSSRGPAVRSSRAQCDKILYATEMQKFLHTVPNLTITKGEVVKIIISNQKIQGVELKDGTKINTNAVVITSGTFLQAIMFTGFQKTIGGRAGDAASYGFSDYLTALGFRLKRLKTGTPPRLNRQSIDYLKTVPQPGDEKPIPFSFYFKPKPFPLLPQISCHITYTNKLTHEIIAENFDKSPMYTGLIRGVGPRYCPSIEDKVKRFSNKERHQIFLEPEGLHTDEIYVNGISTSLPKEVQEKFVRTIPGLEKAEFIKYGYAVEYDAVDARQLKATLESKDISGLFFAGQVNGTSGYEEAGAQGIIAGVNAALYVKKLEPWSFSRIDGYIGVLIDDLILKGTDEPYRMFTSRAEYRLLLREDNADLRLSEKGWKLGLLSKENFEKFCNKKDKIAFGVSNIQNQYVYPNKSSNAFFISRGLQPIKDRTSFAMLLKRPEISWKDLCSLGYYDDFDLSDVIKEQIEIQIKYEGYIQRDLSVLEGVRKSENVKIPILLDLDQVGGLSNEVKQRLRLVRPETIGQISRLPGITPAAVASLMIYLKTREYKSKKTQVVCGK